mgnify:CR=1 FL=1
MTGAVSIFNALYVLAADPAQVLLMSPNGAEIMASAQGPTGTPSGITVGSGGRVWAWSQDTGNVRVFDSKTLSFIAEFSVNEGIFNAVAVGNELYFTTDQGLKVAHTDVEKTGVMTTVETVTGIDGSTYGLAADPARHRSRR